MKISKVIAEQIAEQLAAPVYEKYQKAKHVFQDAVYAAYLVTIPDEILKAFKKHPAFFMTESSIKIDGAGFSHNHIGISEYKDSVPMDGKWLLLTPQQGSEFQRLKQNADKARDKYQKRKRDVLNAILALSTTKRVLESFPEAAPYLPNESMSMQLIPNLDSLRSEIQEDLQD